MRTTLSLCLCIWLTGCMAETTSLDGRRLYPPPLEVEEKEKREKLWREAHAELDGVRQQYRDEPCPYDRAVSPQQAAETPERDRHTIHAQTLTPHFISGKLRPYFSGQTAAASVMCRTALAP